MKVCPTCQVANNDDAAFCAKCGTNLAGVPVIAGNPQANQYDHTAEFDPKDISDNKVFAMLPYLLSFIGVIIALLAAKESKYAMFHARQGLKIVVTQILLGILCIVPFLGWIVAGIGYAIVFVLTIIAFFQVCGGKAKEPAIIRSFGFFK